MTISQQPPPATADLPLSLQQEFLLLFDTGETTGPFGPHYLIADGWRVHGRVDVDTLELALADVIGQHEALRTSVLRDGEHGQRVLPVTSPKVDVRDLPGVDPADRERRAEELINEIEAGTLDVHDLPLLRATLGRFDETDSVLILTTHHSAADAWSMQIILRDLARSYAQRAAGETPTAGTAPQYRDYIAAQHDEADGPRLTAAREYWRDKLAGGRIMVTAADRELAADTVPTTTWHRFVTDAELRSATTALAADTHTSPFMVLLAAFYVLASRWTGSTDLTVPTFTPGRGHGRFQETVGSFFNFVPLRTDLSDATTFRDVVTRTRATCLGAYSHEVPLLHVLQEAPELMASVGPGVVPCLFQVIQPPFVMERERVGDLEYSAVWRRVISQPVGSDMPDGILWSLHLGPSDDIVGAIGFSAHLFDQKTIDDLVDRYLHLLRELLTRPDAALTTIEGGR
ncbi:condensation domain-containing protein [Micromonospora foliorum]|uniref:condensation domain-containing protein n=1 Tax=Micromonospora foliorum TaxID=2911210 RepID=UPI001EE8C41A|nr:condensation domain-containing protein [Micromonospora foliorum]MCG5438993.1 condensation domain-containing protein [Micromonospora foliorum]